MIRRSVGGEWSASSQPVPRRGPLTAVLNTVGPLTIIYPASSADLLDVATRLAHDLFVYLDLDVQILSDEDALDPPTLAGVGNVVVLGDPFGNQWHHVFQDAMRTAVRWQARGTFTVGSRVFTDPGDGALLSLCTEVSALTRVWQASSSKPLTRSLRIAASSSSAGPTCAGSSTRSGSSPCAPACRRQTGPSSAAMAGSRTRASSRPASGKPTSPSDGPLGETKSVPCHGLPFAIAGCVE